MAKVEKCAVSPSGHPRFDLLKAYLNAARRTAKPGAEAYVFIGRKGNALTRHGLYRLTRRYIERAAEHVPKLRRKEINPICSFRHTTAT
jgi:site-specific recombinase XerD